MVVVFATPVNELYAVFNSLTALVTSSLVAEALSKTDFALATALSYALFLVESVSLVYLTSDF